MPSPAQADLRAEADSPAVPHHHRCDAQHSTCSVQEGHGLIAWADPVERRAPQPAPAAAAFLPAAHARPFLLDGMARGIDRLGSRRRSASDLYLLTSRLLI